MFTEKKPTAELMLPFYKKLKKLGVGESCSPSLRENWPNDNIAKGQCFVTAIAVWETLGGEVFELKISENEIHYYNVINGEIVDLSSADLIRTKSAMQLSHGWLPRLKT